MKIELQDQVLETYQMEELKQLGINTSDASMMWVIKLKDYGIDDKFVMANSQLSRDLLVPTKFISFYFHPTYTVDDLIKKLPKNIKSYQLKIDWHDECVEYADWSSGEVIDYIGDFNFENRPIIEALYDCLCWVAENHKELIK